MKNFSIAILSFTVFLFSTNLMAQNAVFLKAGNIQFEKKVNAYAMLETAMAGDDTWGPQIIDAYKKNNPQFKTTNFNLAFDGSKTLYTPLNQEETKSSGFSSMFSSVANKNIVYSDFSIRNMVSEKNVVGEEFLITDSTRQINWKITDETREIAGFTCRRANAVIMDSVYVVAFYTNEITTTGGPESFSGLPGMILGVALPHDHMTWFATKVTISPSGSEMDLKPPTKKGTPFNNKTFYGKLQGSLKDWGKTGGMIMKNAML